MKKKETTMYDICEELARITREDSDAASAVSIRDHRDKITEMVCVVRGEKECQYVREYLIRQKLITEGKSILSNQG